MKIRRGSVGTPGLDVLGPIQEMFRQLRDGTLTVMQIQALVEHRNPFEDTVDVLVLRGWEKFWFGLGVERDFSGLVIPVRQNGFDRLLVVPAGMTLNKLYDLCQKHFSCWRYMNGFDQIRSVRTAADKDYAIWV